ncbi:basic form of pathogenesis-related protein 1-like [Cucurbita maxima]|uniref:Basic form of pathogenesis-related protein 1-like n=1 Tax=Cucurbita maxima TaxID=3661 RepID=A0A6J1IBS1_CUCMA|nr:basic form of pathogenesis-related protein 1-like [Cucurbita maxima]XP_022972511.1 basic form of pathogenesis-related protein 1-like [Cucurbita maxima]
MSKMTLAAMLCLVALSLSLVVVGQEPGEDFVKAHNAVREKKGERPMFWDEELEEHAKAYLQTKVETCEMVHSTDSPYGENLATSNGDLTAEGAVAAWAAEEKFYDHKTNKCVGGECRHYVQLVWNATFLVGCATVKCRNNWTLIGCNYSPAGNVVGEDPY